MAIKLNNILLDIDEDISQVERKACKILNISEKDINTFKILRESIDARKKGRIKFNYTVEITCENETSLVAQAQNTDVHIEEARYDGTIEPGSLKPGHRPMIVGMGPAGLFAGLFLAQQGYKPLIVERGERVEDRTRTVHEFWKTGVLNVNSNVQFGEGGAGAFSDGKLTTRIKDSRCDYILEQMVRFGAPGEIVYSGKPHVGTDRLKGVVKNIREEIIRLGGEILFNAKLEDMTIRNGKIFSARVNGDELPCDNLILAIGHSSRDTYEMLFRKGIAMEPKPFAIGVRIEHPQRLIDVNQYGKFAGHERLKAADYRLTYTSSSLNRAVYTFCMCPGGMVINAASEESSVVVNGMSYYNRDLENANSAVVVNVRKEDFEGSSPLAGMNFQRRYERLAFREGGGDYGAPTQLLGDFLQDRKSKRPGEVKPSINSKYTWGELKNCLPPYVVNALKEGIVYFDRKIKGFSRDDAILTGIETRTSAPLRILRNENLQSISANGLYPAGEGAGYAGGIISAAVDGLKCAEKIVRSYQPLQ